MSQRVVELEGVKRRFGDKVALDDVSFHLDAGEIVGLVGPNGSGKTTTVRLLNGLLRPDAGRLAVNGLDPVAQGEYVRAGVGVLTESAAFYGHLTGRENLRFFARLYGVKDVARVDRLLGEVGLSDAVDRPVAGYSTGMRKRLGLARALVHRPRLLFLDEPTNGLDPEGIRDVLALIRRLGAGEGVTILLCSHLLGQLESVCSRYLFLNAGRLVEHGTLAELEARYRTELVLELDTAWDPEHAEIDGHPTRREGALLLVTVPSREAVPSVVREVASRAALFGARLRARDLEQLYFLIRERNAHAA